MSVTDTDPRVQYVATGGQTNFIYPFRIFDDDDLTVYLTPVGQTPDPNIDLIVLNVDYTVTGAGDDAGGDVVLIVPATAGDILTIERDLVENRPPASDFKVNGDFTAEQLNENLDKIIMLVQQNESLIRNRGLLYPATEQIGSGQTTLPKLPANYIWKANGSQNIVAALIDENPDWSTLRSELASQSPTAPGTDAVGAYNSGMGGGISATTYLNNLYTQSYGTIPQDIQKTIYIRSSLAKDGSNNYTGNIFGGHTIASGTLIVGLTATSNTGPATLAINGETPVPIVNNEDNALIGGEIKEGGFYYYYRVPSSWIIIGNFRPAIKTVMETATTNNFMVTPGNMIHHPGMAKAWAYFDATTTPVTIKASYNVSSITKTGTGKFDVVWSTPFTTANYCIIGMAEGDSRMSSDGFLSTTTAKLKVGDNNATVKNDVFNFVMALGEIDD